MGEIEAAENGGIPPLVENEDIKGALHIHTIFSDGYATVADYVEEARKRGWEYIGVSDHSRSAYYAGGLSEESIRIQQQEIDELNQTLYDVRIFKGIESDILPDGSLDYREETLKGFDFVIASIHSQFGMSSKQMTRRIIRAMSHPLTRMLGHPTGRLLLAREGYRVDMDAIIDAAAKYDVIIELNANPLRLDIDWRFIKQAVKSGVMISINPDAHNLTNLDYIELGGGIARKGWCTAEDVLNTQTAEEVERIFQKELRGVRNHKNPL